MHDALYARYLEMQAYVGWTSDDARCVSSVAVDVEPYLPPLIDDFYDEIQRHAAAHRVITGGQVQIERLKGTLLAWIRELFGGDYSAAYFGRRWRVGYRHVEIGLSQMYTNLALSRLRRGLMRVLEIVLRSRPLEDQLAIRRSLNTLLDLDLAIIEEAYHTEYMNRLGRNERLAAIGQVAGGVAHELRNPLNVVKTSAYYLLNARNQSPEKTVEHLARIERQVHMANGVITALADFARLPMPDLRPVMLAELIADSFPDDAGPENIETIVDCPGGLPPVCADANQLKIAFSNLIRNARDAMPTGGVLTIAARAAGPDKIEVRVSDTGVGIAEENLRRIMEPFYSTKARGIGLGLALTRSIVERNMGQVRVSSELGKGSTFTVELAVAKS